MKIDKELKAYAIDDDFKFHIVQVVISHHKDTAAYWLRDIAGYSNEEMAKFNVWEFPLDKKVCNRDFGETTANDLMKQINKYPTVVFWKEKRNDFYENWLSHFEPDEPNDG